ncbi:MAG: CopG family transcriptional regulator [Burkholderiales bacterium]|nr:CopG family transcriptional regulator [Burkholderiales bacterium]
MRTTLDIEDDVLAAAKDMARREHLTAGQVISRLARRALTARIDSPPSAPSAPTVGGFRPLPARGVMATNDQVNALREREGL